MSSRDLSDLLPEMAAKARDFLAGTEMAGLDVLIYCTRRSLTEQARLFRQGRSLAQIRARARELESQFERRDLAEILMGVGPQHGARILTNAAPGQSLHNYGAAFDCVPLVEGRPYWHTTTAEDLALWSKIGRIGLDAGLEWAGHWTRFQEFPHLEEPTLSWRELIRVRADDVGRDDGRIAGCGGGHGAAGPAV